MSDNGSYIEDMRLVQADSMVEASDKYEKFWNDQSQDYVRTYNVGCQQISEMIVQPKGLRKGSGVSSELEYLW